MVPQVGRGISTDRPVRIGSDVTTESPCWLNVIEGRCQSRMIKTIAESEGMRGKRIERKKANAAKDKGRERNATSLSLPPLDGESKIIPKRVIPSGPCANTKSKRET